MIVAMLIALRAILQKMSVFCQILQHCFAIFVLQRTIRIHGDLPIDFGIEASFPIRYIQRGR